MKNMFTPVITKKKEKIETTEELADKIRKLMEDGLDFLEIRAEVFRLGFSEEFWLKATKIAYSFEGGDVDLALVAVQKDSFFEKYKYVIAAFVALIFILGIVVNNSKTLSETTKVEKKELSRTELLQQKLKALEALEAAKVNK